ncbi:hypothetical protein [Streptomyces beihaiensis]|uniref:Integral membrane protein n=1 Tax=Streptomyces beihaiensis TaxID=2984495 RepID=A0ABT3TTA6_9ACTN|nr:hypothetical protein [Streptomyces beihaiensis]MCX3060278.1 hypothetical protein [Streptomyces beihaiensis]
MSGAPSASSAPTAAESGDARDERSWRDRLNRLRRPLATVCVTVTLVQICGVLPAQIHWADGLGPGTAPLHTVDALRLPTVSPTWLYGGRAGIDAVAYEAFWLALFLLFLGVAASSVARRMGGGRGAPLHLPTALFLLSPLAGLAALSVTRAFRLASAADGGETLALTLRDAHVATPHLLLLGAVAALSALLARTTGRRRRRRPSAAPSWSARRVALFTLATLRGGRHTVRARIGRSLLAGAAYCALITVLSSRAATGASYAAAKLWCADGQHGYPPWTDCAHQLGDAALQPMTLHISPLFNYDLSALGSNLLTFFAYQVAFLYSACVHYAMDATLGPRTRKPTATALFVRHWAGYSAAAVAYAIVIAAFDHPGGMTPRTFGARVDASTAHLIDSEAVHHLLLAAPFAAGTLTGLVLLYRHAPRRHPSSVSATRLPD